MTDEQLLQRYNETGDAGAFTELVERTLGMVLGVALRRCGRPELAEEAAQNTYAILARKARRLADHPVLGGWLHRTAHLEAGRLARSESNRETKMKQLAQMTPPPGLPGLVDDRREEIDSALARLRPAERGILMLRFYEDLSFREVAGRLGKSEAAAQKQCERSLEKLRRILRRSSAATAGALVVALQQQFAGGACALADATSVASSALAKAPAISSTALVANILMTEPHIKSTIVASALILVLALPIGAELKQRSNLQEQWDSLSKARPTVFVAAEGTSAETGGDSRPGLLTAIKKRVDDRREFKVERRIAEARSIGVQFGEFKRSDFQFRKKYPQGRPDEDAPNYAEFIQDFDQLTREGMKLFSENEAKLKRAFGDPRQGGVMFAALLGKSIGFNEARWRKIEPILAEGVERYNEEIAPRRMKQSSMKGGGRRDYLDDLEAIHADLFDGLASVLSADEISKIRRIHGAWFLQGIEFGIAKQHPQLPSNGFENIR